MNSQNIENYSMNELRSYCRDNNIKLYSKFTKKLDLLDFIKEHQQNSNNTNISCNQICYNKNSSYNDEITTQMLNNEYEENLKQAIEDSKNEAKMVMEKYKMEKENQDNEYMKALEQDLTNDNSDDNLNEEELDYQKKITNSELDKIRLARIQRFS